LVQRVPRTFRYYPKGIPKSSVRLVVPSTFGGTIFRAYVRRYSLQSVRSVVPRTFGGMVYRAYIRWSQVRSVVRFTKRTSGGPPAYVRATDTSVRPPDLVYVRRLRVSFQLPFPKVQDTLRLTLRVLGFRLSGYTKGSG
jgi:hypothetical protein